MKTLKEFIKRASELRDKTEKAESNFYTAYQEALKIKNDIQKDEEDFLKEFGLKFTPKDLVGKELNAKISKGFTAEMVKDLIKTGIYPLNSSISSNFNRRLHQEVVVRISRITLERLQFEKINGVKQCKAIVWKLHANFIKKADGEFSKAEITTLYVDNLL